MNQKKKTIVLWGVIIVLAAAVVALSVILVTKSRKNNDPDGQKNAGTEAVIEGSGQDAGEIDLNYTKGEGVHKDITYALSNSLGFGGHNASILVKKWEE